MSLPKFTRFQPFFLVVAAILCSCLANAQTDPSFLSARIIDALSTKEPGWKYTLGFVDTNRTVPSQKQIVAGQWQSPKSRSQDVGVVVYSVENRQEAAKFLTRSRQVADGRSVSRFKIGDEGYLTKYKNGKVDIEFRRGVIVANVEGEDLDLVKEFAQCIVVEIPAN